MIDAITRKEQYLAKAVDGSLTVPKPVTRQELFLAKLAGEDVTTPKPITREEMYLDKIVTSFGGGGGGGSGDTGEDEIDIAAGFLMNNIVNISSETATSIVKSLSDNLALESVYLPEVTTVCSSCFYNCKNLINVYLPKLTSPGQQMFMNCNKLAKISLPNVTSLSNGMFSACYRLVEVDVPKVVSAYGSAFTNCSDIEILELYNLETWYGSVTAPKFKALIIRRTDTAAKAGQSLSVLDSTYIYVPSSLLNTYKSATNWSAHASKFRALEDYTIDGTVTGAFDRSKI